MLNAHDIVNSSVVSDPINLNLFRPYFTLKYDIYENWYIIILNTLNIKNLNYLQLFIVEFDLLCSQMIIFLPVWLKLDLIKILHCYLEVLLPRKRSYYIGNIVRFQCCQMFFILFIYSFTAIDIISKKCIVKRVL